MPPIVFDKREGFFWKGRVAPDQAFDENALKVFTSLGEIHALQLIPTSGRRFTRGHELYELNLVLNDGERLNVVTHGVPYSLRKEAATLAEFLGKPVWDAI
jgi:hypothetical protein